VPVLLSYRNDFSIDWLRGKVSGCLLHSFAEIVIGSDVVSIEDSARPSPPIAIATPSRTPARTMFKLRLLENS